MNADGKMRLGLSLKGLGYHLSAWRYPSVPADGTLNVHYFANSAQIAERAKLDLIFFADGAAVRAQDRPAGSLCRSSDNVEFEPVTLLSALSMVTKNLGLVATASTTYNEPYNVARRYASLDHLSGGRAGWNIVTSWSNEEAQNFNLDKGLDYDTRYGRAAEFVQVVKGLWDSWEEDAFIRDKASGVFYQPGKMHELAHRGDFFRVKGPLNVSMTPQGRPVMFQAGNAPQGREIAAESADAVYTAPGGVEDARAFYADLKGRMEKYGRDPDHLKIMAGITPFVAPTRQEAQDKFDRMQELIDPLLGLAQLYDKFGDLSNYPVDGPVPDMLENLEMRSKAEEFAARARKENLSIRQLYMIVSAGSSIRLTIGSTKDVADEMEAWFRDGLTDGFNICPPVVTESVTDFCDLVVPELQRRGLFRTEYAGPTLRENLGLPKYRNRYAAS